MSVHGATHAHDGLDFTRYFYFIASTLMHYGPNSFEFCLPIRHICVPGSSGLLQYHMLLFFQKQYYRLLLKKKQYHRLQRRWRHQVYGCLQSPSPSLTLLPMYYQRPVGHYLLVMGHLRVRGWITRGVPQRHR
jgi:hypothetical protein